ncbi:hypothetical protein ppKF707_1733 [Metapseudomonas furukawaii]|uniref:Uncharacterized protein n=1 Tax=Metapseudomonas furukawaii TaxID=1149133 RepID=A0AAD1C378_METFU|nr:hypothetical protein ppKF707_1733 [Pseudomonas furukawaii]BAU75232.1 hypothetical protein KF707C_35440 [Pseudomonas furukawaii]
MTLGEAEGQPSQGSFNEGRIHPCVPVSGGSRRSIAAPSDDCARRLPISYDGYELNHLKP